jgi:hypothetical protein
MKFTSLVKAIAVSAVMLTTTAAFAADIDANADVNDIAIKGYDTVAYFTDKKPVMGSEKFSATYKNAIFHFATAEHRDMFKADAAKYAPQYGGYCAMGVAMNLKFDTDPTAWRIVENKLYLNLNKDVQKAWLSKIPANIQTAETNWPELKVLTPAQAKAKNG